MLPAPASTVGLIPDPVTICKHINRLKEELRLANRLLRLSMDSYPATKPNGDPIDDKREAAHASR